MSLIEEAVANRLSTFGGLTALVGTTPPRIWPVLLPQNPVYPAVTYQVISAERTSAMGADTGLRQTRIQVSSWAPKYADVKAVKEQVRAALQRWRGTVLGVVVQDTFIENESDFFDPEIPMYHSPIDVMIWHVEA